jgi:hypothetical protein
MDMAARRASRKAAWRLIPFLMLCWGFNSLDRNNIGFAALTMNKELGFTAEMYGAQASSFLVILSSKYRPTSSWKGSARGDGLPES